MKDSFPILLIFQLDLGRDLMAFGDCLSPGLCAWSIIIIIIIKEGKHFSRVVSNLTESVK